MAEYDELVQLLTFLLTKRLEPKFEFTRGLLGDGNGNVDVPERDGFSYVRPDRNSNKVFEMFNKQAFAADGTPILIGELPWQPGLQQVLGIDWDTYLTVGWENRFAGLAQHGDTHVWRDGFIGEDPFSIYRRQIFDLRCEPIGSGSTSVLVTPYGINDTGIFKTWAGSPGIDLSPAIPSATGTIRNALVYWDFSGDTLYGSLGVATGTLATVTETSIPPRPVEPQGTIPSAYVELQGGQVQIKEEHIKDARPLFSPYAGNDGLKVSKLWGSNFDEVAAETDAAGNVTVGGTRTLTIPGDLIHAGDTDTKLSFADDQIDLTAGNKTMLRLTETTQDLLELGDVGGGGDVDVNVNNGQLFVQGSNGFLGVATTGPHFQVDVSGHVRIRSTNRLKLAGTGVSDESVEIWGSTAASTFNYLELQTPQANERTLLRIVPNGSAGNPPTALEFYGTDFHADTTNWERLNIRSSNSGTYLIGTQANGTGTLRALQITTGTASGTGINVDSNQNIGFGTALPDTRLDLSDGAIEQEEMTAPGPGAANTTRQYAEDDGSGNTQQKIVFNGGHITTIAKSGGLATYTPTNVTTDRSYNANATTVAELADVLGTLIADFQAAGVLG